jgi:crotonobetainyl-CoA:carnitine CoA-transferase CaiB-like acyl-CoA transferase
MDELNVLQGLRVLEVAEGVAGPMCGKVLRDLGSAIIRIEPPDGDWLNRIAPFNGENPIYTQLNDGKVKRKLDLTASAEQKALLELARTSDIIIVGERQAKLCKLGLAYETLKDANPGLIYCHVTGWGTGGPLGDRPTSELCIQVVAGLTRYLGKPGCAPVRQGFDLVAVNTGIAAAQAVLAAWLWRDQSGEGQFVEVSMLATAIALMQWDITAESGPDKWVGRQLEADMWPPDHGFQCADTRCLIDLTGNNAAWPPLLREIGCPELAEDPRFSTPQGLDLHVAELPRLTAERLSAWSFADLERLVRDKYDGTIVPMLSLPHVLKHPQVQHIGIVADTPMPHLRFPMEVQ